MASAEVEASGEPVGDDRFFVHEGPKKGVTYPLRIAYVDVCDGWPVEFCEHHPNYEKGKEWMEKNLADDIKDMYLGEEEGEGAEEGGDKKKKRQTRGGRGVIKTKKKAAGPQKVCLSRASRGKKKYVTVVTGLSTFDVDLKAASKFFAQTFAASSSVTGDDEIVIQGDVKDDLWDTIPDKWPQIDEDNIDDLGDQKRS